CRPCWRVHFQNGCAHKCHYCSLGGLLISMLNVEDYIEHFARLIELNPWQETFLLEDDADVLCLEPELGCLAEIVEFFGRLQGKYLIIHTKSANVDWMADLEHNGNTIIVWSISGRTQSEKLEPVAAGAAERIEAARRAQRAGYTVRYKFKPIIPVSNWREDAAEAVAMIFEKTDPDLISLCVFMWMDAEEMKRRLDASLLDAGCLAAAEAAAERMAEERCKPFPPEVRAEVYELHFNEIRRHSADIPVSLSTESPSMWRLLGERLGATPTSYVCGCGPNSTPWRRKLPCNPFEVVAGGPVGGFEKM
ncbi:MAG: spore photoproduct lyase family protein, partial [Phycisphaerae bacterium]